MVLHCIICINVSPGVVFQVLCSLKHVFWGQHNVLLNHTQMVGNHSFILQFLLQTQPTEASAGGTPQAATAVKWPAGCTAAPCCCEHVDCSLQTRTTAHQIGPEAARCIANVALLVRPLRGVQSRGRAWRQADERWQASRGAAGHAGCSSCCEQGVTARSPAPRQPTYPVRQEDGVCKKGEEPWCALAHGPVAWKTGTEGGRQDREEELTVAPNTVARPAPLAYQTSCAPVSSNRWRLPLVAFHIGHPWARASAKARPSCHGKEQGGRWRSWA